MVSIKLDDALLDGIEQFMATQSDAPQKAISHEDAVNIIVQDWLTAQGYFALAQDEDEITPAATAAVVPSRDE